LSEVTRFDAGHFADMRRNRLGLATNIVRIVLEEAIDLPWRYSCGSKRASKRCPWNVDEGLRG
jgi:hypothetical protein